MKKTILIITGTLLLAGNIVFAQSAYKSLDPSKLAAAEKLTGPQRRQEMDKIIAHLRGIIDKASTEKTPPNPVVAAQAKLDLYQARFKLADVMGRASIEPNANQLILWFQYTPQDRQIILSGTAEALSLYDDILIEFKEDIRQWRRQLKVWIVKADQANQMLANMTYMSTWVSLYRAFALDESIDNEQYERRELFEDLLMTLEPFAKKSVQEIGPRKYWSMWMMALAFRELGEYEKAWQLLAPKLYKDCGKDIRQQILSERIVTFIKQKKFKQAGGELKKLYPKLYQLWGKDSELKIDMQYALLLDYLYSQMAGHVTDTSAKLTYMQYRELSIIDLLDKYPDQSIQRAILKFFGRRGLLVTDIKTLGSVYLLAKAAKTVTDGNLKAAEEMFNAILARNDKASVTLYPRAIWEIALLMNRQKLNLNAADYFSRLARDYPTDPHAAQAAQYAAVSITAVISEREKTQGVSRKLRLDAVEAIELILKLATSNPQIDVGKWYLTLGDLCDKLSWSSNTPEEKNQWLQRGVTMLNNVPDQPVLRKLHARDLALNMSYRALEDISQQTRLTSKAKELRTNFQRYRDDAFFQAGRETDHDVVEYLKDSAAWADFYATRLLGEEMGQKELAFGELEKLPQKWPDASDMLILAKQFEIRKLVEAGRIDQAIVQLDTYRKQHWESARGLISLVISEIRTKITKLQDTPGKQTKLADYRKAYLKFAEQLYQTSGKSNLDKTRDVTLVYVDALNQNSRGKEALKMILKVKADDDAKRRELIEELEKKHNAKIAAIDKSSTNRKDLLKIVEQVKKDVRQAGYSFQEDFVQLDTFQSRLAEHASPGQIPEKLLSNTSRELKKALGVLLDNQKRSLGYDLNVYLNLARSYNASGQGQKAVEYYGRITGGLDVSQPQNSQLFWKLEYELCQTIAESLAGDPAWKDTVLLRIRQLRQRDKDMGQLSGKFYNLEQTLSKDQ